MNTVFIDFGSISDTISKDQFCKICHMSKRTAGKYLGTVIPCGDNARNVMKGYYSHLLHSEKEILRVSDICRITGYGKTIVNTWFLSGNLKYVVIRGAKHTAKEILIDFMSSDAFDKIYRKSEWHLRQIEILRHRL